MPEYHLGIYMGHDTGVAVVDDKLNAVLVFEEERFNGEKMTYFNPYFSLKEMIRLGLNRFRTITFGFDPDEGRADFLRKFVRFQKVRSDEILSYLAGKITYEEVRFVGHHDCHAAGAFFPSGFRNAVVMVADGTGESESTSFYVGRGNSLSRVSTELTNDFSLGILYQYFTEWLGYRSDNTSQHCGKIMGLASYGDPVYKDEIRSLLESGEGCYRWPGRSLLSMREKMAQAIGLPQPRPVKEFNRLQADVAASIQALLEEMVLEKLRRIREAHPFENLCFSGGVAMNSQLNYHILKSGICRHLFVQPLASDRGIPLGAALVSAAEAMGPGAGSRPTGGVYLGYEETSPRRELGRLMEEYDLPVHVEKEEISPREIARLLQGNQILALFQGRQEIGPRALGNRSILAAPTTYARDRTNRLVKYREPWRPFAPTVLEEEVGNFFDIDRPEPFMTVIYGVLPDKRGGMEGVTHVDGTARLQTVSREQNQLFHEIVVEYQKLSNIPILLNTSFNINGQPIVRTIYDAILTFLCSGIDGLLIENTLLRKERDLPKDHLNRLDRILSEATKNAKSIVLQLLDYSEETEALLMKFLECPCIKFRKAYGSTPVSRCHVGGHTKRSWDIVSRIEPWVKKFIYGDRGRPPVEEDEICIMVTGKRLIEASSRPTRTYVRFDRNVFRDIVEDYARAPECHRYYFLDRELHLFDVDYLRSRFEPFGLREMSAHRFPGQGSPMEILEKGDPVSLPAGADETAVVDSEEEDMYETLADA